MQFKGIIDNDGPGRVSYQISHAEPIAPVLQAAAEARAREELGLNKKNEIRPQAQLNWVTVMNIRQKYGIDAMNVKPDQEAKFWSILQTEYPKLLTTNKKVHRRKKPQRPVIPLECLKPDL